MTYPQFASDLQRIHESEVYGSAVFRTAAGLTRDPTRRHKWRTLEALEEATLARYLDYMQRSRKTATEPRGWAWKGRAEGMALGLLPWPLAMRLVRDATGPFLERFHRLQAHARGEDRAFFTSVVAHEKAIESFARKELAGEPDSLKAVEGLLATWRATGASDETEHG